VKNLQTVVLKNQAGALMTTYQVIFVRRFFRSCSSKVESRYAPLLFSFLYGTMNIALIGYGKMGMEIEQAAHERGHTIVQRFIDVNPVTTEKLSSAHCCIDFSTASAVEHNVASSLSSGIPIVIGTTGWHDTIDSVRALVEKYNGALVHGSNFSLGANIFFKIVELTSIIFDRHEEYDVSVHETHHAMKKDAPSGTALTIAHKIIDHLERKERITTSTPMKKDLFVSSSRVGTVVGEHAVRFNSLADDIVLSHTAHSRRGFALGAVVAAERILTKKGMYSFEELLWNEE
jgi:4-hydroxy-tetrahydrodipicolinate reductase